MFGYDALNRLNLAETTSTYATSPSDCWGEIFQYDNTSTGGAWGNLTNIAGASSAYTGCTQENLNMTATSKNQLQDLNNDYVYDAAGNLNTIPSIASYSYDAENHLVTTAGLNYLYDGDGRRVAKKSGSTVTKIYWYGQNGEVLDETDGTGSVSNSAFNEYVFFGGQRVARRNSSNSVNYYFADHLGTARIVVNSSGTILDDSDFYPFGGERIVISSSGNTYKFTGKERDTESGLDNFGARYDSSSMARFLSPDPSNYGAIDESPQTWNAYSYVANNPLNAVDSRGLDCVYVSDDQKSATVRTGDCKSDTDSGIFVDGTVTYLSLSVSNQGDVLNIGFRPDGGGDLTLHGENLGEDASGLSAGIYNYVPKSDSNPSLQDPALAGAGVMALPRLADAANKLLPRLPPQVLVGGAIAAATAYLGYKAYIYFSSEQSLIRTIAREFEISATALGNAVHAWKRAHGMGPADNMTAEQLRELASEVKQGLWLGTE